MSKNNSLSKESKAITSFDDNKIKEALLYLKDAKILSEFEYNQKINSLNVSVAGGIILSEISKSVNLKLK